MITLFDVLEHVDNFWLALENMRKTLKDDGRLILKLPNGRWAYLKYKVAHFLGMKKQISKYLYLEPGGHLNYWDYKSIKKLEKAGFELESFNYVYPYKEQFGKRYSSRLIGFYMNKFFNLNLFPEFIVVFKKK